MFDSSRRQRLDGPRRSWNFVDQFRIRKSGREHSTSGHSVVIPTIPTSSRVQIVPTHDPKDEENVIQDHAGAISESEGNAFQAKNSMRNHVQPSHHPQSPIKASLKANPILNSDTSSSRQAIDATDLMPSNQLSLGQPDSYANNVKNAEPIPGKSGKMVFPGMPMTTPEWSEEECENWGRIVINELEKAIGSHPKLRESLINYRPAMVGPDPARAVPSIVIFCKSKDIKELKKSFKAANRLYCEVTVSRLLDQVIHRPKARYSPKPVFHLVFFKLDKAPLLIEMTSNQAVKIRGTSSLLICGALVRYENCFATLGLTLRVGERNLVLTVDHLFKPSSPPEPLDSAIGTERRNSEENYANEQQQNNDNRDFDNSQSFGLWIEDSDDTDEEDEDISFTERDVVSAHDQRLDYNLSYPDNVLNTFRRSYQEFKPTWYSPMASGSHKKIGVEGQRVEALTPLSDSDPYLDWALLDFGKKLTRRANVNTFIADSNFSIAPQLRHFAAYPRNHRTTAVLVSEVRSRGHRKGSILRGFTYVRSKPAQSLSRLWTFTFDFGELLPGDCGAVVVDAETHDIYGHVVGANPMGHAFVVPFIFTLDQIKKCFNTLDVSLTSPSRIRRSESVGHRTTGKPRWTYVRDSGDAEESEFSSEEDGPAEDDLEFSLEHEPEESDLQNEDQNQSLNEQDDNCSSGMNMHLDQAWQEDSQNKHSNEGLSNLRHAHGKGPADNAFGTLHTALSSNSVSLAPIPSLSNLHPGRAGLTFVFWDPQLRAMAEADPHAQPWPSLSKLASRELSEHIESGCKVQKDICDGSMINALHHVLLHSLPMRDKAVPTQEQLEIMAMKFTQTAEPISGPSSNRLRALDDWDAFGIMQDIPLDGLALGVLRGSPWLDSSCELFVHFPELSDTVGFVWVYHQPPRADQDHLWYPIIPCTQQCLWSEPNLLGSFNSFEASLNGRTRLIPFNGRPVSLHQRTDSGLKFRQRNQGDEENRNLQ